MAVNKVVKSDGTTLIDITGTTATASDVAEGKVFYAADGKKQVGTGEQTTKIDNLLLGAMTEPSASFPVPAVGDNGSTLFGKISKWFSDMAALVATKFNAANVVNNLTTTASGYALDARQGRALNSEISAMGKEVAARIKNEGNFGTRYTNVNLLPTNTIGWANGTGGNISNLPSQSAYHMITVFPLSTHGFQIAIRYTGDSMYVRTYMDGTWSAWKNLV